MSWDPKVMSGLQMVMWARARTCVAVNRVVVCLVAHGLGLFRVPGKPVSVDMVAVQVVAYRCTRRWWGQWSA